MAYADAFSLATDATFAGRCRMALCAICSGVAGEDPAALPLPAGETDRKTLHERRATIARACVTDQDSYIACFARLVALQAGVTKNTADADLLAAGAAAFTQLAMRGR